MSGHRRGGIASGRHDSLADAITSLSGLKGYWKMDDGSGTNVNDYSAGNHDGTAGAGVKRTAAGPGDVPGKASAFGYAAGEVTVAHHADFDVASAWTLVWCSRSWGRENGGGFSMKVNGFPGPSPSSSISGSEVRPDIRVWGGNIVATATTGISDIDQWHIVIRTWNGTTAKIYIDGTDVSGSTTAPSPAFANGSESLTFGGACEVVAHVALFNRAINSTEVATLTAAFNAEKTGSPLPTFKVGIHQELNGSGDSGYRQNAIARLRAVHATMSRNTIYWDNIEATQGNFTWTHHDTVLSELVAGDMEPLAIISTSPTWANGGADIYQVPGTGVDAAFTTWLGLYEDFVSTLVTRYADAIHYWELWNEPNLLGFWNNGSGAVDPVQYRTFYNTIRAAILAVDATAKVSFGGLSSWSATGGGDQNGEAFFRACMAAGSMNIDYFAYHPYTADNDPDTFLTTFQNTYYGDIRSIRDVLLEFGYNVPIWLTEFGWDSAGGANTETTQRDRLQNALEGTRDRLRDIVEMAIVFLDSDHSGFTHGLFANMPNDGSAPTAKLAAQMYSTFAADFD